MQEQDTVLELGLYKDLENGWLMTDSDLVIFDLVSVYPRRWHGLCARINGDRLLVRLNNDSVLTTNITGSTHSQELAVQLPTISIPITIMIY